MYQLQDYLKTISLTKKGGNNFGQRRTGGGAACGEDR